MTQSVLTVILFSLLVPLPLAERRLTDREVDRLKGPVKSVLTEVANYKWVADESIEQSRVLSSSFAYDAEGNRVHQKDYDDEGKLVSSLLFSFIGKDRVAIAEEVDREDALIATKPLPRGRRADPRYSYKFRYKYDANGKRTEEVWYHSDGSMYLRFIYRQKGNRKIVSLYTADRRLNQKLELNQKYEYTFDEKGNETQVLLSESFTGDKITYRYVEFDSQDNWTKRIVTRGFKDLGEHLLSTIRPWSVEYRELTYD